MLIEPTESESLEELDRYDLLIRLDCLVDFVWDRFCDAMIAIRQETEDIISGKQPKDNNVLKNAPHPISVIALSDAEWNRYAFTADVLQTTNSFHVGLIPERLLYTHYLTSVNASFGPRFQESMTVRLFRLETRHSLMWPL